jgi:hypothetical protein
MWRDRKVLFYKYDTDNHKKYDRIKCHLIDWSSIRRAAFNVHGSTLHHLLGIGVSRPEDNITQNVQDILQSQLKNVLCLIIDKRSMLSSKVLVAAVRNIQKTMYNGQNSQTSWEVYQQYSFLATTTNYGRLLRKEQSKVILKCQQQLH